MTPADALDPALLERLRTSGISIDRDGKFWHEGETVQHEGLRRALFRWLDRLPPPDHRYVLRLDERRYAYVDVEDTPFVATSLRWQDDRALLGLNDGSEEPLDVASLTIDGAGVLRAWVREGKLEARLGTSAATVLAERVSWRDDQPWLSVGGTPRPIRRR